MSLNTIELTTRRMTAKKDFAIVIAAVLLFFVLAGKIELAERVTRWMGGYEHWQLDETPLTLLCLAVGLAWFAFRRVDEAQREMLERVRAQGQINELLAHNRELAQRLILTQEKERRALARELHDEVGQHCTAIRAEASYLGHALPQMEMQLKARFQVQPQADAGVAACVQRITQASEALNILVRNMLHRLRPVALDSLGLAAALQELCENWEAQHGVACGFVPRDLPPDLDDSTCITLFRLVQEALTNVARHSGADQVRIDLHPTADGQSLALAVQDNGRGIALPSDGTRGCGLIGMRERVAGLGGQIHMQNAPAGGLRIEVKLPLVMRGRVGT